MQKKQLWKCQKMFWGIIADDVDLWLKQVASRPHYKYLLTLENSISEFRNWWNMIPNLAGSNDNFKSWPSGNMTIASMMFSLPMLTAVSKNKVKVKNLSHFALRVSLWFYTDITAYI